MILTPQFRGFFGGTEPNVALDSLSSYSDAAWNDATFNGGINWSGAWAALFTTYADTTALDSLSSYSDGAFDDASLNGGSNWSGAWSALFFTATPDAAWGNVLFWFRGDKMPQAGSAAVPIVASSAPTPRFAVQATGSRQPAVTAAGLNSLKTLTFDGGDVLSNTDVATGTTYSIYAVVILTTASGYKRVLNISTGDAKGFFGANGANFATFFGNGTTWNDVTANSANIALTGAYKRAEVRNAGATATPAVGSTDQTAKTGTTTSSTGFRFGAEVDSGSITQGWIGSVAEFVITEDTGTTARDAIRTAHNSRWGV